VKRQVTTRDLYNALRDKLGLRWLAGHGGSERNLQGDFPGAISQGLVGPLNCIHPNRIQLIGHAELIYFTSLEKKFYLDVIKKLFNAQPAAVVLADGIDMEPLLLEQAEQNDTPILGSGLPDHQLLNDLQYYLARALAERKTEHGVFMEVLGIGVLITGASAMGKSELALELISRGHRLVADDAPEFARIAPDIISGSCPAVLQDFLEVRGLGVLNIRAMFGDSAIKQQKYLQLIVHLQPMDKDELDRIDRLQGSYSSRDLLGLQIAKVTLPVAPGREMAVLVETAVRQYILLQNGHDAAKEFIERQQQAIDGQSAKERSH